MRDKNLIQFEVLDKDKNHLGFVFADSYKKASKLAAEKFNLPIGSQYYVGVKVH